MSAAQQELKMVRIGIACDEVAALAHTGTPVRSRPTEIPRYLHLLPTVSSSDAFEEKLPPGLKERVQCRFASSHSICDLMQRRTAIILIRDMAKSDFNDPFCGRSERCHEDLAGLGNQKYAQPEHRRVISVVAAPWRWSASVQTL